MEKSDFQICPPKLYGPSITFGLSPAELILLSAIFVFALFLKSSMLTAISALIFVFRFRGLNGKNLYYFSKRLLHFLSTSQALITEDERSESHEH